uniref:Uncharacterized protein n=1 Tax=Glossina pallidipes TaxID=7398 RepID=A0A1A9ZVX6_GLOPL
MPFGFRAEYLLESFEKRITDARIKLGQNFIDNVIELATERARCCYKSFYALSLSSNFPAAHDERRSFLEYLRELFRHHLNEKRELSDEMQWEKQEDVIFLVCTSSECICNYNI